MSYTNEKGKFAKGNPGRPKGSKNKDSKVKTLIKQIVDEIYPFETFKEDLEKVKPSERLQFFLNLVEYIEPKLSRQELQHEISEIQIPPSMWDDEL